MASSRWIFFVCLVSTCITGMMYSLQASFYPVEAKKRGLTATEYGFVFGSFSLTVLFAGIPIGNIQKYFGPKTFSIIGLTSIAFFGFSFGCVIFLDHWASFLSASIACRVAEGIAYCFLQVGVYTIVNTLFSHVAAEYMVYMRISFSCGMVMGPPIGGILYDTGGFLFPFCLITITSIFLLPLMVKVFPNDKANDDSKNQQTSTDSKQEPKSTWHILKLLKVWFSLWVVVVAIMTTGFIAAILAPHLEQFNMSETLKGFVYPWYAFGIAVTSLACGRLCNKGVNPIYFIISGCLLVMTGISLIGPLPFIPILPNVYLVATGLLVAGFGNGGLVIPAFVYMKTACFESGFEDNAVTNGSVSGAYTSAASTGGLLGPLIGGYLFDQFGFGNATLLLVVSSFVTGFIGLFLVPRHFVTKRYVEKQHSLEIGDNKEPAM